MKVVAGRARGRLGGLQLRPVRRRRRRAVAGRQARRDAQRARALLGRRPAPSSSPSVLLASGRRVLAHIDARARPRRLAPSTTPAGGAGRHGRRRLSPVATVRRPPLGCAPCSTRSRATRYVTPLQGGRVAARHRRGRRPRHLRAEVPRRRPGPQGAGRRGPRRRARPAPSGLDVPRLRSSTCRRPIAQVRGRRGGAGPAHREPRPQPRRRLPARLVRLRRRRGRRRRTTAARILWLDAFTANVDRTWSNPNLLVWHGDLWLIDHGAALYFHHGWPRSRRRPRRGSRRSRSTPATHVLRDVAGDLAGADAALTRLVDAGPPRRRRSPLVPDEWLEPAPGLRPSRRPSARRTSSTSWRGWPTPRRGCPGRPASDGACRLPVRRAAVRPARGPRGVPQRRGGPLQPGGRLPRRRRTPSTPTGCPPSRPSSTSRPSRPRCARSPTSAPAGLRRGSR